MADPVIVFGAFDRHNFGDLLFAHITARLLQPRPVVYAGLAERDLTRWGGHRVRAIAALAREWRDRPAHLIHAGGEILTCSLYEAAVMLLDPDEARAILTRHEPPRPPPPPPAGEGGVGDAMAWAQAALGLRQEIAYLVPKALFRRPGRFLYTGVGGVQLAGLAEAQRQEVLARLGEADHVSVRDRVTLEYLRRQGTQADLVPDPAVLTAELFGPDIAEHGGRGEPRQVRARFPHGYLAVQFSADLGDDASLGALAAQLDAVAEATGLGLVLFRAGAAPWHDDLDVYRRLQRLTASADTWLFESLQLWDICALLAGARAFCGTSLHGRIVAESFGLAGVSLLRPAPGPGKQAAYAGTWAPPDRLALAGLDTLAAQVEAALRVPAQARRDDAGRLAAEARRAARTWLSRLS